MICEYCEREHEGSFGSGRFCDTKCARGFSTKKKRGQINKKVSSKMKQKYKGGLPPQLIPFKKGFDPKFLMLKTGKKPLKS